jgi:glycosyltransferase involved in cell wall biosynthesis
MNIGIDAQIFRIPQGGIYTYLWNLVQWICRFDCGHALSLVFYGPRVADKRADLDRLRHAFPKSKIRHVWDGYPLLLLSDWNVDEQSYANQLVRAIDKNVVELWRTLHNNYPSIAFTNLQGALWRGAGRGDFKDFDLFHHPHGLVFPFLHTGANVMTIHDLIPRFFPERYPHALAWFAESFERVHEMDLLLTPSEHTKADVIEILKVPEEKIRVTPLAADEQYRPLDKEEVKSVLVKYGIDANPYLLSVGTLEYRRNMHRLIEAFRILKQEQKTLDHKLVLVGRKGESWQIIFETVDKLDLRGNVLWLGHVPFDELPALMNGAEAFVYPSAYEGFGLPPLEAMACGTPVVSSRASSLPEVIGDAGIFFDPYDTEAMAAALHAVLANRCLRKELRNKGLTRAKAFSWKRTTELTLSAYMEACARFREDGIRARALRSQKTRAQEIVLKRIFNDLRRRCEKGSNLE